jgi:hypothetical protein
MNVTTTKNAVTRYRPGVSHRWPDVIGDQHGDERDQDAGLAGKAVVRARRAVAEVAGPPVDYEDQ